MLNRTRVFILFGLLTLGQGVSWAAPIGIGPFVGNLQETWESFDNYQDNPNRELANPAPIMGGAAMIGTGANQFNPNMLIYEPSAGPTMSSGTSGFLTAQVADGTKAMGIEAFGGADGTATISFAVPINAFGAYWGAWTGNAGACCNIPDPATISLNFFDASLNLIDTDSFDYSRSATGDGLLEWHGWSFATPVGQISYEGNVVKIDGLQAQAVPEPGALALLCIGVVGVLRMARSRVH